MQEEDGTTVELTTGSAETGMVTKKRTRAPKAAEGQATERIHMRSTAEFKALLGKLAEKLGIKDSDAVVLAVREKCRREGVK